MKTPHASIPGTAALSEAALVLIGRGGHAKVVLDVATALGKTVIGCIDSSGSGADWRGLPLLGGDELLDRGDFVRTHSFAVAIGEPARRLEIGRHLIANGGHCPALVHPGALVSPSARIESGVQVIAGAVVNADATLEMFSLVNTGATVDHDCRLGPGATVAPGAHLGGNVALGEAAFIGMGAIVTPGVVVGDRAFLYASTRTSRDVTSGTVKKR